MPTALHLGFDKTRIRLDLDDLKVLPNLLQGT